MSEKNVQYALVAFGTNTKVYVDLKDGVSEEILKNNLDQMTKIGGTRNLHTALDAVNNNVLSVRNGNRPDSKMLIITMMTGLPHPSYQDDLSSVISSLDQRSAKMLFLEVGEKTSIPYDIGTVVNVKKTSLLPSVFPDLVDIVGLTAGSSDICFILVSQGSVSKVGYLLFLIGHGFLTNQ